MRVCFILQVFIVVISNHYPVLTYQDDESFHGSWEYSIEYILQECNYFIENIPEMCHSERSFTYSIRDLFMYSKYLCVVNISYISMLWLRCDTSYLQNLFVRSIIA